jgi:putative inorganic carbon (HCO3(-)) transporter
MLAASGARHLPLSSHPVHCTVALLTLVVIILTPNIRLLPEAWTGALYNDKRLSEILLLCTYGLLLILSRTARTNWRGILAALPLTARAGFATVLGLGLLSALRAARPDAALLEVANVGLLFVLALGIASWVRDSGQGATRLFIYGIAAMALAYETRFLAVLLAMLVEHAPFSNHDLFPGFVNLRFFNQIQTWTLPLLALPFWLAGRSHSLRLIVFTGLVIWWLLLFISSSRGALLAVCGGAALTFAVFRQRSLPWLKIQSLAAMVALAVYFTFYQFVFLSPSSVGTYALPQQVAHVSGAHHALPQTIAGVFEDPHALPQRVTRIFEDPTRIRLLNDAWNMFLHAPLLGSGPMHYAYYFHDSYLHPHNSWAQLLSEWGLPATLLLLLLSFWGIAAWIKKARNAAPESNGHTHLVRVALLASLGGAALQSLVCGTIVMPLSQLLAACVVGLMLGDYLTLRTETVLHTSPQNRQDKIFVLSLATAVLALGSLSMLTLFDARGMSLRAAEQRAQASSIQQNPRFWLPGQLKYPAETAP